MDKVAIKLSVLWAALMFTYLLGDVLRVYSGDVKAGEILGQPASQGMYLGIAVFMLIPIIMMILAVILNTSWYDKFLIIVGLVINVLTVGFARKWRE